MRRRTVPCWCVYRCHREAGPRTTDACRRTGQRTRAASRPGQLEPTVAPTAADARAARHCRWRSARALPSRPRGSGSCEPRPGGVSALSGHQHSTRRAWREDGAVLAGAATEESIGCRRVRTMRRTSAATARDRHAEGHVVADAACPASSAAVRSRCAAPNSSSPPMPVSIDPPRAASRSGRWKCTLNGHTRP